MSVDATILTAPPQATAVKKGNDWVINGSKMWITGAGHANWFFVLAKTEFVMDILNPIA